MDVKGLLVARTVQHSVSNPRHLKFVAQTFSSTIPTLSISSLPPSALPLAERANSRIYVASVFGNFPDTSYQDHRPQTTSVT